MKLRNHNIPVWPLCLILLISIIFSGNSNVLCIGQDGQLKFETESHPCPIEAGENCQIDMSNEHHDKHLENTGCWDLPLDMSLWSNHLKQTKKIQPVKPLLMPAFQKFISDEIVENCNFIVDNNLLAFTQSPPSASIATTCLRC